MISVSTQSNIQGTRAVQTTNAGSAMPFGFTFALQSLRSAYGSISLANAYTSKDAKLNQHDGGHRSKIEWGSYRV